MKASQGSLLGESADISDAVVGVVAKKLGYEDLGVTTAMVSDWVGASECPLGALEAAGNRLAVIMDLEEDWTLAGLTPGGETVWRADEGGEMVLTVQELFEAWKEVPKDQGIELPLSPVIRAFCEQPRTITPDGRKSGRVIPARLAMVSPGDPRSFGLFSPAAHVWGKGKDQLILPGFEDPGTANPVLPLLLYDMGAGERENELQAPGAPLALRIFVESILAVKLADRTGEGPMAMKVTLREFLKWLYPGTRRPRPSEYWDRLMRAVYILDSQEARIPWYDPKQNRGGQLRVVSVGGIPRGPDCLDDDVRIIVDLPPGSEKGPQVSDRLREYGLRSAVAYRILLHLAYRWHHPGRTLVPVGGGRRKHWVRSYDPSRYDAIMDDELVQMAFPTSAGNRRRLLSKAKEWVARLEREGELQVVEGKILPPESSGAGQRVSA